MLGILEKLLDNQNNMMRMMRTIINRMGKGGSEEGSVVDFQKVYGFLQVLFRKWNYWRKNSRLQHN